MLGRDPREAVALARLAERYALPVIPFNTAISRCRRTIRCSRARRPARCWRKPISSSCSRPTCPGSPASGERPADGARIVQIGEDPLYARFRCAASRSDLTIDRDMPVCAGTRWSRRLAGRATPHVDRTPCGTGRAIRGAACGLAAGGGTGRARRTITPAMAQSLPARDGRRRHDRDQRIFVPAGVLPARHPRQPVRPQFRRRPGLGFPRFARVPSSPRQTSWCSSVLGDGAYMFANPTACHYVAQMQNLPVLTVIYNNALYGAVRRATLEMYEQRRRGRGGRAVARGSAPHRRSKRSSPRMMDMGRGWNDPPTCPPHCAARPTRSVPAGRRWSMWCAAPDAGRRRVPRQAASAAFTAANAASACAASGPPACARSGRPPPPLPPTADAAARTRSTALNRAGQVRRHADHDAGLALGGGDQRHDAACRAACRSRRPGPSGRAPARRPGCAPPA